MPGGSHKDRIRAVKLYIKLGKHAGATIRQLGETTGLDQNSVGTRVKNALAVTTHDVYTHFKSCSWSISTGFDWQLADSCIPPTAALGRLQPGRKGHNRNTRSYEIGRKRPTATCRRSRW